MKKYIILLLLLSCTFFSYAQNTPPSNAEMRLRADTNYLNLVNGVLLVRLSNPQKKIAALRKYGYAEEANNILFAKRIFSLVNTLTTFGQKILVSLFS
jgi:hypothetical protein